MDAEPAAALQYWQLGWRTPLVVLAVVLGLLVGWRRGRPTADAERRRLLEEMYAAYRVAFRSVSGISAEEVLQHLADGDDIVLVDVRPVAERRVSTLPGAVPIDEVLSDVAHYRDRTLVTYCTVGGRSGIHALLLGRRGLRVRNLVGSILAWTHVGGELVAADGSPTRVVHVYGERWKLSAAGYEPVITDEEGVVRLA